MTATHSICLHCQLGIEGISPYRRGQWRDRGNNTHCPDGRIHAPVWRVLEEPYTLIDRPLSWQLAGRQQTASGYGRALTSTRCVQFADGRIRRVYVTIFSNAGTAWIRERGQHWIVRKP